MDFRMFPLQKRPSFFARSCRTAIFSAIACGWLAGCASMTPNSGYQNSYADSTMQNSGAGDSFSYGYSRQQEATVLDSVLVNAIAQIGKPYVWGGESRSSGFDCSGLIQYVLGQAGVHVPRTAADQAMALPAVSLSRLRRGDLLFFNTLGRPFTHVGIYIGGGQFVSALNAHDGITVQNLHDPYWAGRLDGIRQPIVPGLQAMRSSDEHVLNR